MWDMYSKKAINSIPKTLEFEQNYQDIISDIMSPYLQIE